MLLLVVVVGRRLRRRHHQRLVRSKLTKSRIRSVLPRSLLRHVVVRGGAGGGVPAAASGQRGLGNPRFTQVLSRWMS